MYRLERARLETGTEAEQQRGGTVGIILICEFLTDVFIRPTVGTAQSIARGKQEQASKKVKANKCPRGQGMELLRNDTAHRHRHE